MEENARAGDNIKPRLIGGAHYEPPFAARQGIMPRNVESRLPPMPNVTASPGSWQNVPGTRYKFYVFSAYYDWRVTRLVRVIGATKTRGPERVWCRLWSSNNNTSVTVPGKVKVIRENWNLKYSACFVLCPLRENQTVPSSVSVVSRLRVFPTNHLRVHNMQQRLQITTTAGSVPSNYSNIKMAVCVKPIHFNYNRAIQMMEFLEMNALLGVNHFTLYNDTMSPSTSCLLHDYVSRGLVTILPWKLDMVSQREIRTEGLFAALNDCLYRSMYLYTHVALIDLDEFIMPRHNDTLPQFIQWMNTRMNTRTGSYSFQNAFFYLQWPDDSSLMNTDEIEANLITLRKTRRKAKLHPHKQRSKYICRPEFVVEAGNHFVWEFIPGHGTLNVPADAAILNHYRVCEFGGDDCVKSVSVIDKTALRYKKKLVGNIRKKWNELKDKCGFDELKPRVLPKIKL